MHLRRAGLLALALSGCAHSRGPGGSPYVRLDRQDWVVSWSHTVEVTEQDMGRTMKIVRPALGAVEEVLLRKDYDAQAANDARPLVGGVIGNLPPTLLRATAVDLDAGRIKHFYVEGESIRGLEQAGTSAQVYWTIPHKQARHRTGRPAEVSFFSEVFVRGASAGLTHLRVELADGSERVIPISVR